MTSSERRREGRYLRRKAAREAKKQKRYATCDNFQNLISYQSLYAANKKSKRNVTWKASVQRYQMNLLRNLEETRSALNQCRDITKGFVEFDTMERGKVRHIRSIHFSERVIQRSVCDNALVPMLRRSLIYDNGACLEGKGVDQALDRLTAHLQQFYRRNGFSNDGWAVIFDFSKFFDNILHNHCFEMYNKEFRDILILWLLSCFILPFGYPFHSVPYRRIKRNGSQKGYTGLSLGLGSQVSQITAVAYPSVIDHFIKEKLRVKFYGRYMDDGYMLFATKAEAMEAIKKLTAICKKFGITINPRKTHVAKLKYGIRFLKVKLTLTETGKVLRRADRSSIVRQRRKLKKFASCGKLTLDEIANSHASWKGHMLKRGGGGAVKAMDALYYSLFGVSAPKCIIRKRRNPKWKIRKAS